MPTTSKKNPRPKVVIIGGGTGTFVVLSGLRSYPVDLTAVVSMMDSGGSNKVLRDEFGLLPTSGVRQCLVALSDLNGDAHLIRQLFSYRYHQGVGISGMTFGNLFMAALADILGSQVKAIAATERLLRVKGRVLPVTLDDSHLVARYDDGRQVLGEHFIDEARHFDRRIVELETIPRAGIYPPVRDEILKADLIILGPGDLYTNTIADLVVDGVILAIKKSRAKKVFVMNLMNKRGETGGYKASDFIYDLEKYLGKQTLDYILINDNFGFPKSLLKRYSQEASQPVSDDLTGRFGYKIIRKNFLPESLVQPQKGDSLKRSLLRHDPKKLAKVIMSLV